MVLALLEAPVSEADRQGTLAIVGTKDDRQNGRLVTFNCNAAPERTKRNRRNARDIRKALPDVIVPDHPGPDPVDQVHTDMLKAGPTPDYIPAQIAGNKRPGYSKWMTLAALDMPMATFKEMLCYFVDQQYRSVVFYIRSGPPGRGNMQLFSRDDFDYWGRDDHIIERCELIAEAGMAPCPTLMSNADKTFNSNWEHGMMPRILNLLERLHTDRGLVDRVLYGIETDKQWNNGNRNQDDIAAGKNWFGIRQVRDTLGGHAHKGGLKSIHFPDIFWIGHTTHIWLEEHGRSGVPNYAGPQSCANMTNDAMYPWFDGIYHQPSGRWGIPGDLAQKIEWYKESWRKAIPMIKADDAVPMLFEHSQEPRFWEDQAFDCAEALLGVSRQHGLVGDSFGTGRRRR